jgi:hypothetical protein
VTVPTPAQAERSGIQGGGGRAAGMGGGAGGRPGERVVWAGGRVVAGGGGVDGWRCRSCGDAREAEGGAV